MAEQKTVPTASDPAAFLASVEAAGRRENAQRLLAIMTEVTGERPVMWGPSMIGFGSFHYRYASGHEGDAPLVGFSPRKANLVFYLYCDEGRGDLLARLGKHKSGKGCVYVNRLSDIDPAVLKEMAVATAEQMRAKYPA